MMAGKSMKTIVFDLRHEYERALHEAAREIRAGGLVAFPTETVYGLGADAANEAAVRSIFTKKGRPADNPLIAHICDFPQAEEIACDISPLAHKLMRRFWPGPFTAVLRSRGVLAPIISAGLDTIAVRMPRSETARDLIRRSGRFIAAPSANLSGKPSPTRASHVLRDFDGKIPIILDGGPCDVGLESTVCDLTGEIPVVLRPGGVTAEMIKEAVGRVQISPAVLHGLPQGTKAASPGMKYKHYAPRARVCIVKGEKRTLANAIKSMYDKEENLGNRPCIFCVESDAALYGDRRLDILGGTMQEMAQNLFDALRRADDCGVDAIYFEAVDKAGIGLAIMNRVIRAAGFDIVDASKEEEIEKHFTHMHG